MKISSLLLTESSLIRVSDVEEAIEVLSLLVNVAHQSVSLEKVSSINKEVKRASLWKLDSLSDDVVEVIGREVVWNEIPVGEEKMSLEILTMKIMDENGI